MTGFVVRADHHRGAVPSLRYWHADTGRWGEYATATRYDTAPLITRVIVDALGEHSHAVDVSAEQAHGVDVDGFPYVDSGFGLVRLTHCCAAACTVDDGPLYCKSCYREVDWAYDGPARLAPDDPDGPRGPITVRLPQP